MKKKSKVKKSAKSKYQSNEELEITAGERKWLLVSMKTLKHIEPEEKVKIDGVMMKFDMERIMTSRVEKKICNTAGCIKGWMFVEAAAAKSLNDLDVNGGYDKKGKFIDDSSVTKMMPDTMVKRDLMDTVSDWVSSASLSNLFFPQHADMGLVTPKIAARAIESFMIDGPDDIDWGDAGGYDE